MRGEEKNQTSLGVSAKEVSMRARLTVVIAQGAIGEQLEETVCILMLRLVLQLLDVWELKQLREDIHARLVVSRASHLAG